jgi:hypothetical protein
MNEAKQESRTLHEGQERCREEISIATSGRIKGNTVWESVQQRGRQQLGTTNEIQAGQLCSGYNGQARVLRQEDGEPPSSPRKAALVCHVELDGRIGIPV